MTSQYRLSLAIAEQSTVILHVVVMFILLYFRIENVLTLFNFPKLLIKFHRQRDQVSIFLPNLSFYCDFLCLPAS